MEEKLCRKCGLKKPHKDFALNRTKPDGLQAQCRVCKKKTDAKHYSENREEQLRRVKLKKDELRSEINDFKASMGCRCCPERTPCCLDFHHPDENKEFGISGAKFAVSREKLFAEMKKCILLCANCHRKLHNGLIPPVAQLVVASAS